MSAERPTDDDVLRMLETDTEPYHRAIAMRRLGALAFRAGSMAESEQLYGRSFAIMQGLFTEGSGGQKKPTQAEIVSRAHYNLSTLQEVVYVEGRIPSVKLIAASYNRFLKGISTQAQRARRAFSGAYPVGTSRQIQQERDRYHQLVGIFNTMAVLGLLLREEAAGKTPVSEVALPAFIDRPLTIAEETENGEIIKFIDAWHWHINIFQADDTGHAVLAHKIYTRLNSRSPHDERLPDDTAIIWTVDDLCLAAGLPAPRNELFLLDTIRRLAKELRPDPLLDKQTAGLRRALGSRTYSSLTGNG